MGANYTVQVPTTQGANYTGRYVVIQRRGRDGDLARVHDIDFPVLRPEKIGHVFSLVLTNGVHEKLIKKSDRRGDGQKTNSEGRWYKILVVSFALVDVRSSTFAWTMEPYRTIDWPATRCIYNGFT